MQDKFGHAVIKFEEALVETQKLRDVCLDASLELDRFKGDPVVDGCRKKLAVASECINEGLTVRGVRGVRGVWGRLARGVRRLLGCDPPACLLRVRGCRDAA